MRKDSADAINKVIENAVVTDSKTYQSAKTGMDYAQTAAAVISVGYGMVKAYPEIGKAVAKVAKKVEQVATNIVSKIKSTTSIFTKATTEVKATIEGMSKGDILFGQKNVSQNFSKTGNLKGESINSVAEKLKTGEINPNDLPIEYIKNSSGQKITVNNRSLAALSKADMFPTVTKNVSSNTKIVAIVTERVAEMGGSPKTTIIIRGIKEVVKIKK
jgi:hypothetical protein